MAGIMTQFAVIYKNDFVGQNRFSLATASLLHEGITGNFRDKRLHDHVSFRDDHHSRIGISRSVFLRNR